MGYILAGDHLVVGTENRVTLYRSASGEVTWEAEVQGRAYGLAAAGGRLFVSTDRGHIYCFGPRR
jgi:outer membrane protein assembly factor BamB